MEKLVSTNPAKNYEKIGETSVSSEEEVHAKVERASKAKQEWKELGVENRAELLRSVLKAFFERKKEFPLLITREMGKTIKGSRGEVEDFFSEFEWFLEYGPKHLADEITSEDESSMSRIVYEPWGVSAVILPWNYPLGLFLWGVVPNLIAGNTVVMKHSEECPLLGKLVEETMENAALPEGVFSEVYGDGKVGEKLASQDIDLLWFTGSSKTGKHLFEMAGKKFIKSIMELGGSDPGIVFQDADLKKTQETIIRKRFSNCGQICCALKRLIVHETIFDEVVEKLSKNLETKTTGNPEEEETDFGSLVSKKQLDVLEAQVKDAVSNGAKVVTGGKKPENLKGAYYLPTVLTNISRKMLVWKEEVFGPVLPVVPFKTEREAIKLASDTRYGLSSLVFTEDKELFHRMASKIEAGSVHLNHSSMKSCDPFGGYKDSGMGRELGRTGFQELCQIKLVSEQK